MTQSFETQLSTRRSQLTGPVAPLQAKAWEQVSLPTKKSHGYRYVPLRPLDSVALPWDESSLQVSGDGAEVLSLGEALRAYGTYLRGRWNALLKQETDPLATVNAALHTEGWFVYVPPGEQASVRLSASEVQEALTMPRIHLFVGGGATIDLRLEGPLGPVVNNSFLDLHLEESARASVLLHAQSHQDAWCSQAVRATLKRSAHLEVTHLTDGAQCVRLDADVTLGGEGAEADLKGAWLLRDKRQAHMQIRIAHAAPHTRSRQLFKGVLGGRSKSSFAGMIDVDAVAQQTDAFQLNKNLLLSDHAVAYTRPELEVRADDVKASHGATVGRLDPDEQFYLESRGLSTTQVRRLLVGGFVREIAQVEEMVDGICGSD